MPIYLEEYIADGLSHPLFVRQWLPDGEIFGLVQICHGMAEHSRRYKKLGNFLAEQGYAVFCHDHRGHGNTPLAGEPLGFFAEKDGWNTVCQDALDIGAIFRARHPEGPFILFGHSMGSLVASDIAAREDGSCYDGFILCGSPSPNKAAPAGRALADAFCKIGLSRKANNVLNAVAFSDVNKLFAKDDSPHAWLTSDKSHRENYSRDPLCGFVFTSRGFYDLFDGICRVRSDIWALTTLCKPYLLISGELDPIGNCGKGVRWIEDQLKEVGRDVKCILYPGKRHEILNETDSYMVYDDILNWIKEIE
ncbi:MAG: alpha/beta fold hydrolase [Clostridia bacterium]|nr:alpha/beta fold hydrolase [Clostridia bacterium]